MTSTEINDPFGAAKSGGTYPKADELVGKLIMLTPSKVETIPDRFNPGSTTERATADTVVFEDDGTTEKFSDMYWSQGVVVGALKNALKPGEKPMVLGRLVKVATKATREALKIEDTPEAFEAARADWLKKGGRGTEPKHVWLLAKFSDEDASRARAYLAESSPFA